MLNTQDASAAIDRAMARILFLPDGTIIDANALFLDAMGYRLDEIKGKHHSMFMYGTDATEQSYRDHWLQLRAGEVMSGEFKRKRKDGSAVFISASYSPVLDQTGSVVNVLKYATDITSRVLAVDSLRDGLNRMSRGEFGTQIDVDLGDDFNSVRDDFNRTQNLLFRVINDVHDSTGQIDSSSDRLSSGADALAERTEQQIRSLSSTTSAISDLHGLIDQGSRSASSAHEIVSAAQQKAEAGTVIMSETQIAMERITSESKEISKIVELIEQIAFQTNLLALNAGIEAARAGEAGRGFSVVASEVRALAHRSSEAATQIGRMIESSAKETKTGVELVSKTHDTLEAIRGMVTEALDQVTETTRSIQEQSSGLNDITGQAKQLDQLAQQNREMFRQTRSETDTLAQQVQAPREATNAFGYEGDQPEHRLAG